MRSRGVVNATGVWTDDLQHLVGERGKFKVRASKGIHLVVPRPDPLDTGLILRTEKSVLFVIPWGRHWIVGTTDTDWELDKAHPAASSTDIDYVLEHVNAVLSTADPRGRRGRLRRAAAAADGRVREHLQAESRAHGRCARARPGGRGRRQVHDLPRDGARRDRRRRARPGPHVPPSATAVTPLVGADGFQAMWNRRDKVAAEYGVHVARVEHLLRRYGTRTEELLAMVREEPELGKPLPGADDYLAVEARYAVTHEGALHLDDVLTRRTRISIETWDRGLEAAEAAADLIAGHLGWDDTTKDLEIKLYRARVAAERRSQEQPDDRAADLERTSAPDVFAQK